MTQSTGEERVHVTSEFDRWWQTQGRDDALEANLEPAPAKRLAWRAWREGREQMSEATASQRLQPARR